MAKHISNIISLVVMMISILSLATQIHVNHARKLLIQKSESEAALMFQNIINYGGGIQRNYAIIHLYVQDATSGPFQTVYEIARSPITANSSTFFGLQVAFDNLVTAEPDRNSTRLGRLQGLATSSGLESFAMTMDLNFVFTAGKYNGSSVSVVGRNPAVEATRELSVVGGTGVFRMARGFAVLSNFQNDVIEYTIYTTYSANYYKGLQARI